MDREQFIQSIAHTYSQGLDLVKIKNQDYAADQDPFKNFRTASMVNISVEGAILIRVMDKISRVGNLLQQEAAVKDESLEDALLDAINYLAILKAYRESK